MNMYLLLIVTLAVQFWFFQVPSSGAGLAFSSEPALQAQDPFAGLDSCRFNAYSARDDLIIGAVMLNLETGTGCTQNLNTTFPVASVLKIFVADTLYQQVAEGLDTFDRKLMFSPSYYMGGRSDCLTGSMIGQELTLGFLSDTMIQCSDNTATWMLMDYLGWETVNAHAQSFGIEGIGTIVPYVEVDYLKLQYLDSNWANVPRGMASQFYRRNPPDALVPAYFSRMPQYSDDDYRAANDYYLETYGYNTATPRALVEYMLRLRNDLLGGDSVRSTVARWIFNTMLLTQRGFSTQFMPGTVLVGSKNGFDLGYRAEVNITVRDLEQLLPETISFIVVRHRDVTAPDVAAFRFRDEPVTDLLLTLAPYITRSLYPDYNPSEPPLLVGGDFRVRQVVFDRESSLWPCYQLFQSGGTLPSLQQCWQQFSIANFIPINEPAGVGLVLQDLQQQDVRMTLVFTLPDGFIRSYQLQRFLLQNTAVAWFENVAISGTWRIDVYFNLVPVFSQQFTVA
jgi:hypothetical protein